MNLEEATPEVSLLFCDRCHTYIRIDGSWDRNRCKFHIPSIRKAKETARKQGWTITKENVVLCQHCKRRKKNEKHIHSNRRTAKRATIV